MLGIGIGAIAMIYIVWNVFQAIANWKAIIPVYNTYITYKATWNTKMFLVNVVLSVLAAMKVVEANAAMSTVFSIVSGIAMFALVVVDIMEKIICQRLLDTELLLQSV